MGFLSEIVLRDFSEESRHHNHQCWGVGVQRCLDTNERVNESIHLTPQVCQVLFILYEDNRTSEIPLLYPFYGNTPFVFLLLPGYHPAHSLPLRNWVSPCTANPLHSTLPIPCCYYLYWFIVSTIFVSSSPSDSTPLHCTQGLKYFPK